MAKNRKSFFILLCSICLIQSCGMALAAGQENASNTIPSEVIAKVLSGDTENGSMKNRRPASALGLGDGIYAEVVNRAGNTETPFGEYEFSLESRQDEISFGFSAEGRIQTPDGLKKSINAEYMAIRIWNPDRAEAETSGFEIRLKLDEEDHSYCDWLVARWVRGDNTSAVDVSNMHWAEGEDGGESIRGNFDMDKRFDFSFNTTEFLKSEMYRSGAPVGKKPIDEAGKESNLLSETMKQQECFKDASRVKVNYLFSYWNPSADLDAYTKFVLRQLNGNAFQFDAAGNLLDVTGPSLDLRMDDKISISVGEKYTFAPIAVREFYNDAILPGLDGTVTLSLAVSPSENVVCDSALTIPFGEKNAVTGFGFFAETTGDYSVTLNAADARGNTTSFGPVEVTVLSGADKPLLLTPYSVWSRGDAELSVPVDLRSQEFYRFMCGNELVKPSDCAFEENSSILKIKETLLNTLPLGVHSFLLETAGGRAEYTVLITDRNTVTIYDHDRTYNKAFPSEMRFAVDLKGNDVQSAVCGDIILTRNRDYRIDDRRTELTLTQAFLSGLPEGEQFVDFTVNDQVCKIKLNCTDTSVYAQRRAVYSRDNANVSIPVDLKRNLFLRLEVDDAFVDRSSYVIAEDRLVMFADYLDTLITGEHLLELQTFGGGNAEVLLSVYSADEAVTITGDTDQAVVAIRGAVDWTVNDETFEAKILKGVSARLTFLSSDGGSGTLQLSEDDTTADSAGHSVSISGPDVVTVSGTTEIADGLQVHGGTDLTISGKEFSVKIAKGKPATLSFYVPGYYDTVLKFTEEQTVSDLTGKEVKFTPCSLQTVTISGTLDREAVTMIGAIDYSVTENGYAATVPAGADVFLVFRAAGCFDVLYTAEGIEKDTSFDVSFISDAQRVIVSNRITQSAAGEKYTYRVSSYPSGHPIEWSIEQGSELASIQDGTVTFHRAGTVAIKAEIAGTGVYELMFVSVSPREDSLTWLWILLGTVGGIALLGGAAAALVIAKRRTR